MIHDTSDDLFAFTMAKLALVMDDFIWPEETFISAGEWLHQYDWFTLSPDRVLSQGEITVQRKSEQDEGFSMQIHLRRLGASGYHQFTEANLTCVSDSFATPTSWSYSSKMAKSVDGPAYLRSGLEKSAEVKNGKLLLTVGEQTTSELLEGAYTCKFNLLEAVQRLPNDAEVTHSFALIDEWDQVRGVQQLSCQGTQVVEVSGRSVALTAFLQTGMGVLPTVYLRDSYGRLLFVVHGLEIYVLQPAGGGV